MKLDYPFELAANSAAIAIPAGFGKTAQLVQLILIILYKQGLLMQHYSGYVH